MVKPIFEGKDGNIFRFIDVRFVNALYRTVQLTGHTVVFSHNEADDFKKFVKEYKEYIAFFTEHEIREIEKTMRHNEMLRKFEKQESRGK